MATKITYKHFGILQEITKDQNQGDIELCLDDDICVNIPDIKNSPVKNIVEIGRIICYVTDQPSQGSVYNVYVKVLPKDFQKDGWFEKNQDYHFNPQNKLEGCPGFVLIHRNK